MWDDGTDRILGGDYTAALGYVTAARGVVVIGVDTAGVRDREKGTIAFSTSLSFSRKLDRMRLNPQVALAYHTRERGFNQDGALTYLLVQGRARFDETPDPTELGAFFAEAEKFVGVQPSRGFWGWWMRPFVNDRIVVTIEVQRILAWADLACTGEPQVVYGDASLTDPDPQSPPAKGTGPRIDLKKASKRLDKVSYRLLGYVGGDGFPLIVPVEVGQPSDAGLPVSSRAGLPAGGRRAGLLGHSFPRERSGLVSRQYTGWLEDGVYFPHTEAGFAAPASRTVENLIFGAVSRLKHKKRPRQGARADVGPTDAGVAG